MVHFVCNRQSTRCYCYQYFDRTTPRGFLYLIEENGAIVRMRMSKALVICLYALSIGIRTISRLFQAVRRQKHVPFLFFFEKERDKILTFQEKRLMYSFHKTANLPVSSCHREKQLRNDLYLCKTHNLQGHDEPLLLPLDLTLSWASRRNGLFFEFKQRRRLRQQQRKKRYN